MSPGFEDANTISEIDETFSATVCQNVLAVKNIEWFKSRTGYLITNQQVA